MRIKKHLSISIRWIGILLTVLLLPLAAHAQKDRVSFSASEMTAAQAIAQIEQQTGYEVAFYQVFFDPNHPVTIEPRITNVQDALNQIIGGRDYRYMLRNKYIIISPVKPAAAPPTPPPAGPRTLDEYDPNDPHALDASPLRRPITEKQEQTPGQQIILTRPAVDPSTYYSHDTPPSRYAYLQEELPRFALKTNLLYGAAALTPNLGVEIGLGPKTSLSLVVGHNPWNYNGTEMDNKKFVHTSVRPEFRYWTCERFNGHFFGVSAFYLKYNISGYKMPIVDFEKDFRYQGTAIGGGLTYGYHLPLSKQWGLEFSVGVGVAAMKYKSYDCALCGEVIREHTKTYFGPTNAGISLVFMIR